MRKFIRSILLSALGRFAIPACGVHILNLHFAGIRGLSMNDMRVNFKNFLDLLEGMGELIDFDVATDMVHKKLSHPRPAFALSFDDGFLEMFTVVLGELNERGIKAAFFVNTGLFSDQDTIRRKVIRQIGCKSDERFMDAEQVRIIFDRGQIVGNHSLSHARLSKLTNDDFVIEAINSKLFLENIIGGECEYFAWPFGLESDISSNQIEVLSQYYPHIYSGFGYPRLKVFDGRVIVRRHIEPFWYPSHIRYFVSKKET
jgi:peptidoglycan/xylan/chitin deacetylase (PgdA/CDA1 family)